MLGREVQPLTEKFSETQNKSILITFSDRKLDMFKNCTATRNQIKGRCTMPLFNIF